MVSEITARHLSLSQRFTVALCLDQCIPARISSPRYARSSSVVSALQLVIALHPCKFVIWTICSMMSLGKNRLNTVEGLLILAVVYAVGPRVGIGQGISCLATMCVGDHTFFCIFRLQAVDILSATLLLIILFIIALQRLLVLFFVLSFLLRLLVIFVLS